MWIIQLATTMAENFTNVMYNAMTLVKVFWRYFWYSKRGVSSVAELVISLWLALGGIILFPDDKTVLGLKLFLVDSRFSTCGLFNTNGIH